jgi:hypothetical protein
VIIICPFHGEFKQKPIHHLRGQGCNKCSFPYLCDNTKEFIEKSNKVHNYKYDYSKTVYKKPTSRVIITCPFHDDFKQVAHKHLRGQGCKKCNCSGGFGLIKKYEKSKEGREIGMLYCVEFINKKTKEAFYKIGITKQSIKERYNKKEYNN